MLVDRANLLTLTVPEMTVLVGGMRALNANAGQIRARRVHQTVPARSSNDFFVNLLDMAHEMAEVGADRGPLRRP